MKRQILSRFLALCLCLTLVPVNPAHATGTGTAIYESFPGTHTVWTDATPFIPESVSALSIPGKSVLQLPESTPDVVDEPVVQLAESVSAVVDEPVVQLPESVPDAPGNSAWQLAESAPDVVDEPVIAEAFPDTNSTGNAFSLTGYAEAMPESADGRTVYTFSAPDERTDTGTPDTDMAAPDTDIAAPDERADLLADIAVTAVRLNQTTMTVNVTESASLTATVQPANATNKTVTWISSNASVASVDSSGRVSGVSVGTATITARADGVEALCTVTVIIPVTEVKLNKDSTSVTLNTEETLTAEVLPSDATNKTVTWTSSNTRAVTVSATGVVKAVGSGQAVITAAAGGKNATCVVNVIVPATGVKLNKTSLTLGVGKSEALTATVEPNTATDKTVVWKSSNTEVATVDTNGQISALKEGSALISAQTGNFTANCVLTVVILPTSITLSKDELSLLTGESEALTATVLPATTTDKTITWTTSAANVATVSTSGRVTAVNGGKATITAKAGDVTAQCTVTVIVNSTGVTLNQSAITLNVGATQKLNATVAPNNTTDKTVTWSSSNDKVAIVDTSGSVTAIGEGRAIINAKNGQKDANCVVTVVIPPASVTLDKDALSVVLGQSATLTATVLPATATNKTVTWKSSTPNSVTVDSKGVVKAVGSGRATITATAGTVSAQCAVTVIVLPEEVTLNKDETTINVGMSEALTATVLPATTSDKTVTWTTSNERIATVDKNGRISAIREGTATITAAVGSGTNVKRTTCEVTVVIPPSSVTLDQTELTLAVGGISALKATVLPENTSASVKTVTWTSANAAVASVDGAGRVTGLSKGTTTITATAGTQSARCTVNVMVPVRGITLNSDTLKLNIGRNASLRAVIDPADANTQIATWKSSDESVATVDAQGVVTGLAEGKAVITATAEEHAATCEVTVVIPAGSVVIDPASLTIDINKSQSFSVTIEPENTTDKAVTWTSSNPDVATIAPDGVLKALSGGTTTITATVGELNATCAVTVVVPVAKLTLNKKEFTLDVGSYEVLQAEVLPETATDKTVTWTSSDDTVATVNQVGRVTGVKEGTVAITAAAGNEIAECYVRVVIPAQSIRFLQETLALTVGQNALLEAVIEPDNVTDKTITWTSSNTDVAKVDEEGRVTAIGGGTAIVAATVGSQRTSCEVTVSVPVGAVRVTPDELTLNVEESDTLRAFISPANATEQTITWSSSNTGVVTVDESGVVTAVEEGTAVITATAGEKTANCTVTVVIPVSGVTLEPASISLDVSASALLRAIVEPDNATSKTVTWSSSDAETAVVDSNGRVTAMKEGTTVIIARAGNQSARCVVTVSVPVSSVVLSKQEMSLEVGRSETITATILPETATDQNITWSSSDTRIAVVDRNGKISATGGGTAIITARAGTRSADCTVTVTVPVSAVELDQDTLSLETSATAVLRATVSPDNASDKSVTWFSSDDKIAVVNENGRVTGVSGGTVLISAMAGTQIARCLVTVTVPVSTVRLNRATLTISLGASDSLAATVEPAGATDKTVTWSSSNMKVATVDRNGRVTAVSGGTAVITARSGSRSADCTVTVTIPVNAVTLNLDKLSLQVKESALLEATILPETATVQNVTWASNDVTVAAVDTDGRVTAVSGGSAVITATAEGKSARCTVEVTVPVSGVSLNKDELSLSLGRSEILSATVKPDTASDKTVTWSSSNPDVATVDRNGRVTATGRGNAVITAASGGQTADCTVTVSVAVTGIRLNQSRLSMVVNTNAALSATVSPSDATDKTVTWSSNDEKVATVDANGRVTAVGGGTTVIVAQAGEYSVRCTVTVTVPVSEVKLNKSSLRLVLGTSEILDATVSPEDATDKTVTWSSSNAQVAAVDRNGRVTAAGGGTALITARSGSQSADCTVTVTVPVSTVRLDRTRLNLTAGGSEVLTATVLPADATDKSVTWTSSNTKVATVDENGRVTGTGGGSATITARSGSQTASCIVAVTVPVSSIQLNREALTLAQGSTATLTATIAPETVSDKTITWKSSDESVAVVDKNGNVTGANGGTAIITATAGGVSADCTVIVTVQASRVLLDRAALSLNAGDTWQLSAVIEPANVTEKTVTWTSSNPEVAVVNGTGRVTAISGGSASITAAVGGRSAQCRVTVTVPVTSITLAKAEMFLNVGASETLQPVILPSSATERTVTWSSSNTAVAVVDKNGRVTGAAEGVATVTVAASGHTASCRVTVSPRSVAVTSVFLNAASLTLTEGEARTLTVTILPSNATDRTVTWSSSNPAAATVDETGRVRALSEGVTTITAQVSTRTAACRVTVKQPSSEPEAQIQSAVRNGASVSAVISTAKNAVAYCVVYSPEGRMLGMKAQTVTATKTDYTFVMDDTNYSYANIFVLDSTSQPVCEQKRAG